MRKVLEVLFLAAQIAGFILVVEHYGYLIGLPVMVVGTLAAFFLLRRLGFYQSRVPPRGSVADLAAREQSTSEAP